jgi:hypothetical protein
LLTLVFAAHAARGSEFCEGAAIATPNGVQ